MKGVKSIVACNEHGSMNKNGDREVKVNAPSCKREARSGCPMCRREANQKKNK